MMRTVDFGQSPLLLTLCPWDSIPLDSLLTGKTILIHSSFGCSTLLDYSVISPEFDPKDLVSRTLFKQYGFFLNYRTRENFIQVTFLIFSVRLSFDENQNLWRYVVVVIPVFSEYGCTTVVSCPLSSKSVRRRLESRLPNPGYRAGYHINDI